MIQFLMKHTALAIVLCYGALSLVSWLLLLVWMEDDARWSGANASPGLCKSLGRGLRRIGGALGRFRPYSKN